MWQIVVICREQEEGSSAKRRGHLHSKEKQQQGKERKEEDLGNQSPVITAQKQLFVW